MTDEYVEKYLETYTERYKYYYDLGLQHKDEVEDDPMKLDSYHVLTIIKNIDSLINNHLATTNIKYVKDLAK